MEKATNVTLKVNFVIVGPGTYNSVDPDKTRLNTFFGIAAGLYLGYMGVIALEAFGYPLTYIFPTAGVVIALVAGIIFGVLAAIIPARQASRLEIVQALRYE